jgi:excisionase family DNA binding protein
MIGARDHFTVGQVARQLAMSKKTVLRAIHRGELVAYRYSARVVIIERPDIEAFLFGKDRAPFSDMLNRPRRVPKEVAGDCGVPLCVVARAIRLGELASDKMSARRVFISADAFAAWREKCRAAALVPVERDVPKVEIMSRRCA